MFTKWPTNYVKAWSIHNRNRRFANPPYSNKRIYTLGIAKFGTMHLCKQFSVHTKIDWVWRNMRRIQHNTPFWRMKRHFVTRPLLREARHSRYIFVCLKNNHWYTKWPIKTWWTRWNRVYCINKKLGFVKILHPVVNQNSKSIITLHYLQQSKKSL